MGLALLCNGASVLNNAHRNPKDETAKIAGLGSKLGLVCQAQLGWKSQCDDTEATIEILAVLAALTCREL